MRRPKQPTTEHVKQQHSHAKSEIMADISLLFQYINILDLLYAVRFARANEEENNFFFCSLISTCNRFNAWKMAEKHIVISIYTHTQKYSRQINKKHRDDDVHSSDTRSKSNLIKYYNLLIRLFEHGSQIGWILHTSVCDMTWQHTFSLSLSRSSPL